jgi:hypothetical protein
LTSAGVRSSLTLDSTQEGIVRRLTELWPPKRGKKPPRVVYVGSYEDKLSRIRAMRVDPDDDGRTSEDVSRERAYRRGIYGGGPPSRLID